MEISAKDVMALRKASGMGMMECKKALEEAGGDFEKAFEILRKRGLKAAEKKADRATAEGLVGHAMSADGHTGTMLLVLCETEPVKNTAMFQDFVATATQLAADKAPADLDALLALPWPGDDGDTVDAALKSLIGKIGENMRVSGYKRLAVTDGVVGAYVHHDKKTGAIVALEGKSSDELADFAKQLCMHIVFSKPTALDRDEIPADDVQREPGVPPPAGPGRRVLEGQAREGRRGHHPGSPLEELLRVARAHRAALVQRQQQARRRPPEGARRPGEGLRLLPAGRLIAWRRWAAGGGSCSRSRVRPWAGAPVPSTRKVSGR